MSNLECGQDIVPSREDTAEYLADAIDQLRRAASRSGFEFVAYVLDIATIAALEAAGRPGRPAAAARPLHS